MQKAHRVLGIGNDIIEIGRIQSAIERQKKRFLTRLFTPQEQEYCLKKKNPFPHLAGRFCAKEAIAKALGTGFGKELSWQDIEVRNDSLGKPTVYLSKKCQKRFSSPTILLSISHCKLYASAVAIVIES